MTMSQNNLQKNNFPNVRAFATKESMHYEIAFWMCFVAFILLGVYVKVTMALELQLLARACGKTNVHSLEPEDLAALTMEASALAKVPLTGTNHTVGVDDFHKI